MSKKKLLSSTTLNFEFRGNSFSRAYIASYITRPLLKFACAIADVLPDHIDILPTTFNTIGVGGFDLQHLWTSARNCWPVLHGNCRPDVRPSFCPFVDGDNTACVNCQCRPDQPTGGSQAAVDTRPSSEWRMTPGRPAYAASAGGPSRWRTLH